MLIVCPSCASEYMIDPVRLGPNGRTVRCASCRATWFVTPEAETGSEASVENQDDFAAQFTETDEADDTSPPEKEERSVTDDSEEFVKSLRKERFKPKSGRLAAQVPSFASSPLLLVAGALLVAAALLGRAQVARMFPRTAALYAGIGLPVNLRGIEFRAVRSELVAAGPDSFLVVEGEVANVSGRDTTVPPIEVGLQGAEGQTLYTWSKDPPLGMLKAGESAQFRARLASPPAEARRVLVHFTPGLDGAALASQAR
jgi:predicted Zn finger-like uncharacterized protein